MIGGSAASMWPRLSFRIARPVQSTSCKYSLNEYGMRVAPLPSSEKDCSATDAAFAFVTSSLATRLSRRIRSWIEVNCESSDESRGHAPNSSRKSQETISPRDRRSRPPNLEKYRVRTRRLARRCLERASIIMRSAAN